MPIRQRITPALPILIFLFAYFFTTVLGNILYTLPLGRKFPTRSMPEFTWEQFHQPLDARFWLLVLCPLLVTPVGAYLVARFSKPAITGMSAAVPEFSRQFFVAVNAACLLFVGFHLYDANALGKLLAGKDALDAVRYRFDLLGEIGRAPRFVLMSILQFLSCYAMVKAIRSRKAFWVASAIINIVFVSAFFILLNMKWPIVLFQITLASVAFICVPRRYIVVSSLIFAGSILTYFTVSVALLRIPLDISAVPPPSIEKYEPGPRKVPPPAHATDQVVNDLVIVAINRMAMAVPFYYDTFTSDGPVCGSFLDKVVLRKPEACHPSIYIYSKMFPDDGFNGRGTAPAAHQIYEYARSGWPGATIAVIIGAVIIGLYTACFFARDNPIFVTAFVMGIPASYLLSQLPVEAMIISELGAVWWILLIAGYFIWRRGYPFSRKPAGLTGASA